MFTDIINSGKRNVTKKETKNILKYKNHVLYIHNII